MKTIQTRFHLACGTLTLTTAILLLALVGARAGEAATWTVDELVRQKHILEVTISPADPQVVVCGVGPGRSGRKEGSVRHAVVPAWVGSGRRAGPAYPRRGKQPASPVLARRPVLGGLGPARHHLAGADVGGNRRGRDPRANRSQPAMRAHRDAFWGRLAPRMPTAKRGQPPGSFQATRSSILRSGDRGSVSAAIRGSSVASAPPFNSNHTANRSFRFITGADGPPRGMTQDFGGRLNLPCGEFRADGHAGFGLVCVT